TGTPAPSRPTQASEERSRASWLTTRTASTTSSPSMARSSSSVFGRCVPVATRMVTSSTRTIPSSSSRRAGTTTRRGCGRVPSQTLIATVWPGSTSSRSGGPATGRRSASRTAAAGSAAGGGWAGRTTVASSGTSTGRMPLPYASSTLTATTSSLSATSSPAGAWDVAFRDTLQGYEGAGLLRPGHELRALHAGGRARGRCAAGRRRGRRRPRDEAGRRPRRGRGGRRHPRRDRRGGLRGRLMAPAGERQAERERKEVVLDLGGMTCASCAARIERKLNRLEGVEATVNFATEQATVRCDPSVSLDALVGAVESAGYDARPARPAHEARGHEGHLHHDEPAMVLARRLGLATVLTVPVALLGMVPSLRFAGWEWAALALSTPVVFVAGSGFHLAASMDTLISIGTLAAWTWSVVVLAASLDTDTYFEVAAVVTTLIVLGRFLEARAKSRSSQAIRALLELGAKEARVLRDGEERLVPADSLAVGDLFVVRPGEKVATDGVVVEGASALDRSLLTGESVPVEVGPGEEVVGATVNTYGRLVVRATKVGSDTALRQIARLVERAQAGKAPVQRLADRVSAVFVPVVLAVALATLAGWLAFGG